MTQQPPTASVPDVIEDCIAIAAPVEQVWQAVAVPGWWIVDMDATEMATLRAAGEAVPVRDAFQVDRLSATEPQEVSFKWLWTADENRPTTTVTFHLAGSGDGTELRVTESGLATGPDQQVLATHYEENRAGWTEQLALAKRVIETGSTS